MEYPGFIGGHVADSPLSEQTCINVMTAPVEGGAPGQKALVSAPGLGGVGYYFFSPAPVYSATGGMHAVFSHNLGSSYAPYSFAMIGNDLWCHEWAGHESYRIGRLENTFDVNTGVHVANDGTQLFITNGADPGYIFPWSELAGNMYGPHGAWAASTAYSSATPDTVLSSAKGYHHIYFECTASGTSGGTEPTWDYTVGNTTADGTVTWTARARLQPITDSNMSGMTLHSAQFIGGYFVAVDSSAGIGKFISSYHTGLTGVTVSAFLGASGLAWSTADAGRDDIVTLAVAQNKLWIFGTDTLEWWQLSGGAKFPFGRVGSARYGCESLFSVSVYEDMVFWRGRDAAYRGGVFMFDNAVRRVSTTYLDKQESETVASFTYRWNGQTFYLMTLGDVGTTSGETWIFSVETGDWHRYGGYQDGAYRSSPLVCAGDWYNGKTVFGDETGSTPWVLSATTGHDGNTAYPLRRERIFPEIRGNGSMVRHRGLDIEARQNETQTPAIYESAWQASYGYTLGNAVKPTTETGWIYRCKSTSGTSGSTEPTWPTEIGALVTDGTVTWVAVPKLAFYWLDWSDDRGATWSTARDGNFGNTSDTYTLQRFRGLGSARRRLYRIISGGYCQWYLLGADIALEAGRH